MLGLRIVARDGHAGLANAPGAWGGTAGAIEKAPPPRSKGAWIESADLPEGSVRRSGHGGLRQVNADQNKRYTPFTSQSEKLVG